MEQLTRERDHAHERVTALEATVAKAKDEKEAARYYCCRLCVVPCLVTPGGVGRCCVVMVVQDQDHRPGGARRDTAVPVERTDSCCRSPGVCFVHASPTVPTVMLTHCCVCGCACLYTPDC